MAIRTKPRIAMEGGWWYCFPHPMLVKRSERELHVLAYKWCVEMNNRILKSVIDARSNSSGTITASKPIQ